MVSTCFPSKHFYKRNHLFSLSSLALSSQELFLAGNAIPWFLKPRWLLSPPWVCPKQKKQWLTARPHRNLGFFLVGYTRPQKIHCNKDCGHRKIDLRDPWRVRFPQDLETSSFELKPRQVKSPTHWGELQKQKMVGQTAVTNGVQIQKINKGKFSTHSNWIWQLDNKTMLGDVGLPFNYTTDFIFRQQIWCWVPRLSAGLFPEFDGHGHGLNQSKPHLAYLLSMLWSNSHLEKHMTKASSALQNLQIQLPTHDRLNMTDFHVVVSLQYSLDLWANSLASKSRSSNLQPAIQW